METSDLHVQSNFLTKQSGKAHLEVLFMVKSGCRVFSFLAHCDSEKGCKLFIFVGLLT